MLQVGNSKLPKIFKTVGVKALRAKLHPKTVICNLLITVLRSQDGYWTVYEEKTISCNATLFT